MYTYAANNPVHYIDPDGKKLYVSGSKKYLTAVQRELSKMCPGTIINFDTGKVTLSATAKNTNPNGYAILSELVNSSKTNIIWIGDSQIKDSNGNKNGNSASPYHTRIALINGILYADYNKVNGTYGPMNSVINFDPDNWEGGQDDEYSTTRPPYIGLAHESGHSEAINNGTQTYENFLSIPGTTPNCETNSLKRENEVRVENHLTPRSYYIQPIPRENQ